MSVSFGLQTQHSCWGDSFEVSELRRLMHAVESRQALSNCCNSGPENRFTSTELDPQVQVRRLLQVRPGQAKHHEPKIRAILWDNDGVLVDSEQAFLRLTQRVFRDHGLDLEERLWATNFLGKGRRTAEIAMSLGLEKDAAQRLASQRDILWRERLRSPMPLVQHAESQLQQLRENYRMAVVTGAPRIHFESIHRFTNLAPYFEMSVTADECPKVKPEPDAFLLAARRMGLQPCECLVIEDSPRGLKAGLAAGMHCALLRTDLTDFSQCGMAEHVLNSLEEIPALLHKLNQ